jgi:hypothetical protein
MVGLSGQQCHDRRSGQTAQDYSENVSDFLRKRTSDFAEQIITDISEGSVRLNDMEGYLGSLLRVASCDSPDDIIIDDVTPSHKSSIGYLTKSRGICSK